MTEKPLGEKKFGWLIAKPDGKTDIGRAAKEFDAAMWAEFESIISVTSSFARS